MADITTPQFREYKCEECGTVRQVPVDAAIKTKLTGMLSEFKEKHMPDLTWDESLTSLMSLEDLRCPVCHKHSGTLS